MIKWHSLKNFWRAALAVAFLLPVSLVKADLWPAFLYPPTTVTVEVVGDLPGFTHDQLTAYIASTMQNQKVGHWRFLAMKPGDNSAANKVVWKFKVLGNAWHGGTHHGFPSDKFSNYYLNVEIMLYLKGRYQMTLIVNPTMGEDAEDGTLAEMVADATRTLFVKNASALH